MPKEARQNRVPIMMTDDELVVIDDWRFANRVASRSDAIRRLCKIGLDAHGQADLISHLETYLAGIGRFEHFKETFAQSMAMLKDHTPRKEPGND